MAPRSRRSPHSRGPRCRGLISWTSHEEQPFHIGALACPKTALYKAFNHQALQATDELKKKRTWLKLRQTEQNHQTPATQQAESLWLLAVEAAIKITERTTWAKRTRDLHHQNQTGGYPNHNCHCSARLMTSLPKKTTLYLHENCWGEPVSGSRTRRKDVLLGSLESIYTFTPVVERSS